MPTRQVRGSDDMRLRRTPSLTPDEEELHRCKAYRKSFPMTEIAFPATALRNRAIAKWVGEHRVTVDVRSWRGTRRGDRGGYSSAAADLVPRCAERVRVFWLRSIWELAGL